jgi:dihydrofolate reductase
MIRIISAVSENGIIGLEDKLPWQGKYTEDMKFFHEKTKNSTVIMGRCTFQSIGKALPKRRNIVISKFGKSLGLLDNVKNIEVFDKLEDALKACDKDVWIIGGESIYFEGMKYADQIYITLIPEFVDVKDKKYAKFPWINPMKFSSPIYYNIGHDLCVAYYNKI